MSERTIFTPCDVFISWNNQDRELKDKIVEIIRQSGHSVWESDYECTGSIKDACLGHIPLCKTFLILLTHNSINSHWVKDELEVALAMEGAPNRMIPLVMDAVLMDRKVLQQTVLSGTVERLFFNVDEGMNVSAIVADSMENEDAFRNKLIKNIEDLCLNRCYHDYVASLQNVSITIPMLSKKNTIAAYADLHDLYIPRILKKISFGNQGAESCKDEQGLTETEFLNQRENSVIIGTGGSGKSQYLNQITAMACSGEDLLVFPVRCTAFMRKGQHLKNYLYDFFAEKAKHTTYKQTHFDALLDRKKDKLLLLLDGIDEIITENDFWVFRRAVENFLSEYPQARVVFTTRNQRDADRLVLNSKPAVQYWLDPFTQSDVRKYTQQLFLAFGNGANGEQFYMDISTIDDEIKCNPLLISQLAVIYANSGKLPHTIVEIFDIVTEMVTSGIDSRHDIDAGFPTDERFLLAWIPGILREMAYSKFEKYALAEKADNIGLVSDILQKNLGQSASPLDCRSKAERILDYLDRRAILYQDEFAHKMFLEYFTAVHLYEECFDGKGNIRNEEMLTEYFRDHYHDSYWTKVTELFLSKADHKCSQKGMAQLYQLVCKNIDGNYDLLFRMCKVFSHRTAVEKLLLRDILERTLSGEYSAYAQLFCYVPRENLYDTALTVAGEIWLDIQHEKRLIMLSLLRDVCYILGGFTSLEDLAKDQRILRQFRTFAKQQAESPRSALNAMFCGVKPAWLDAYVESQTASPVYPFYFNVHAVATTDGKGFGKYPLTQVFADELGLYGQTEPDDHGRYWGLVSLPYCKDELECELQFEYADGMTGLILLPSEERTFEALNICNAKLEMLMLPSSITELGEYCFVYYGVDSPNGIRIFVEYGVQDMCSQNSNDPFPEGHTKKHKKDLGWVHCGRIMQVALPLSATKSGQWQFDTCENLISINLPAFVAEIPRHAFHNCVGLQRVYIPENLRKIKAHAFDGCISLERVYLPFGLAEIGDYAFADCKSLTEITIPNSVNLLGGFVFRGCTHLLSATVPSKQIIEENILFEDCYRLQIITTNEGAIKTGHNQADADWAEYLDEHLEDSDEEHAQFLKEFRSFRPKQKTNCKEWIVDAAVFPTGVISGVSYNKNYPRKRLVNAVVSEGIYAINPEAFMLCDNLLSITIAEGVRWIGDGAFSSCTELTHVEIPSSVTEIGVQTFEGCEKLSSVILPVGIQKLSWSLFANCRNLTCVQIPHSVKQIDTWAFYNCTALVSICIPSGITGISNRAFENCASLTSIFLPDGVTKIYDGTFAGCVALEEIGIPNSVTFISTTAFSGCHPKRVIIPVRFRDKISAIFGEFKSIELHKEDSQLLVVEF